MTDSGTLASLSTRRAHSKFAAIREEDNPNDITLYRMHVSSRYLDLTRKKLELTRLPRDLELPDDRLWSYGTPKSSLEPLIDFWLGNYNWRSQESNLNATLPQSRTTVSLSSPSHEHRDEVIPSSPKRTSITISAPLSPITDSSASTLRIHFVHKRSPSPEAIPLLFCHSFSSSFAEISKVIDVLTNPVAGVASFGVHKAPSFHVVAPSIPGFGFSDASPREGFGLKETADAFDKLMVKLGYREYVVHGCGWGFQICRFLALHHANHCLAVHTVSPSLPALTYSKSPAAYLKYRLARLTTAQTPLLSFGYSASDFDHPHTPSESSSHSPPPKASQHQRLDEEAQTQQYTHRPQTLAYSLCDSPAGLLAAMLDNIGPDEIQSPLSSRHGGSNTDLSTTSRGTNWTKSDLLTWTMLRWLPGPEASLRWLRQSVQQKNDLDARLAAEQYSAVPLGISHWNTRGSPPQWAASYHNLAWVKRRQGFERTANVRFPAWEAPDELVRDVREFFDEVLGSRFARINSRLGLLS